MKEINVYSKFLYGLVKEYAGAIGIIALTLSSDHSEFALGATSKLVVSCNLFLIMQNITRTSISRGATQNRGIAMMTHEKG